MLRTILALLLLALPLVAQQPSAEVKTDTSKPLAAVMENGKVGVVGEIKEQTWNFQPGSDDILVTARSSGLLKLQSAGGAGLITVQYTNGSVSKVCLPCGTTQMCHEFGQ